MYPGDCMSAVLQSPTLPTLMNLEDIKAYIDSEIEKGIEKGIEKALPAAIEKVLFDPENPLFIKAVESILAISDLKILKRLYTHDVLLGLQEPYEDEDVVSIPARIEAIENKALIAIEKPTEIITSKIPIIPTTSLEIKASAIVEHLKEKVKPRNDAVFMNSNEIINFLKCELPENMRLKEDARNPRQAKKDILEKAVKLFSDSVLIIRNKSGNKVTGIALKPSVKCKYTDTCC
jgi:hypothetical protein